MENKTSKYFKYAIGEILLVVIGILIALQINNWNENRKANIEEQNLFRNLKVDFEFRLTELKEFNKAREETTAALLDINSIIADKDNRPNDSIMDRKISKLLNGFKFNEEFKMLDVVFNTGLINDITNEKLKRQLVDWPQRVEEMLEEQRMHNSFIDNDLRPFLSKYISLRDVYEKFDFRQYNLPKGDPVTLKKNYPALLSDPIFENHLVVSQILIRVNYIDTQALISAAEEIIGLLNIELRSDD
ncbi:MAG: hypothetical protein HKO81_01960 [Flavobacteriaceae bacterium]|nr:hypothetical protein [Flavobacteriaceae bacterium]